MKAESQASILKFKIFATFAGHIHSLIPALREINNTRQKMSMIKLSSAPRFKHVYSHFHFFGLADAMFSPQLCRVFADEERRAVHE